jgi:hypothetical protein
MGNCRIDHSAQTGSSVTTSSKTLVSTNVIETSASCQGHDFIGAQSLAGPAPQGVESAGRSMAVSPDQNDTPIRLDRELDRCPGYDSQSIPDGFGNRHLAFAGHLRRHGSGPVLLIAIPVIHNRSAP